MAAYRVHHLRCQGLMLQFHEHAHICFFQHRPRRLLGMVRVHPFIDKTAKVLTADFGTMALNPYAVPDIPAPADTHQPFD